VPYALGSNDPIASWTIWNKTKLEQFKARSLGSLSDPSQIDTDLCPNLGRA